MPVDVDLMGKLLALSRSDEPAEAELALSRFSSALNRWCREQGIPAGSGYVTLDEPSAERVLLAEVVGAVCDVRILLLEPYEMIAVGPEQECRWVWWWFRNAFGPLERTASRANFRERHAYMRGAILGIEQELSAYMKVPELDLRKVEKAERPAQPMDPTASGEPAPAKEPAASAPKPLTPPQRSAVNDGMNYGRQLARELLTKGKPPARR